MNKTNQVDGLYFCCFILNLKNVILPNYNLFNFEIRADESLSTKKLQHKIEKATRSGNLKTRHAWTFYIITLQFLSLGSGRNSIQLLSLWDIMIDCSIFCMCVKEALTMMRYLILFKAKFIHFEIYPSTQNQGCYHFKINFNSTASKFEIFLIYIYVHI